jgi:hypothetical protein
MDNPPFPNQAEDEIAEPSYDGDVVAWANEQARRLRAGEFHRLDIEHIADEIEDVGKAEQRELVSRMAVLIAHLLKWQYQPERRGRSWESTINVQRRQSQRRLRKTPSLRPMLKDPEWISEIWGDGVLAAMKETGLEDFPETCPWDLTTEVLKDDWLPTSDPPA